MTRPGRACAARACSSSRRSLGSPSQALLTRQTLVDLIAMDRATHQPQLVIFRVWPDYPMYAQIDRSARTVSSKLRSWLLRPSHGGAEDPADAHLQQQLAATTQRATTDRHPPPRIGEREHGPSTVAPTLCKEWRTPRGAASGAADPSQEHPTGPGPDKGATRHFVMASGHP